MRLFRLPAKKMFRLLDEWDGTGSDAREAVAVFDAQANSVALDVDVDQRAVSRIAEQSPPAVRTRQSRWR